MSKPRSLPLVYSCSGCSSAAQMANQLALQLDRQGVAEMSCIAGVGGDIPAFVKVARSGRPIVGLDGCPLRCVEQCLSRHGVTPTLYHVLSDFGVKKRRQMDFDEAEMATILSRLLAELSPHTDQPAETAVAAAPQL